MGAHTYEWVHRASHDDAGAVTGPWAYEQPCWVFTHRDLPPAADNVTVTQAPVPQVHAAMVEAAGDQDIWVVGGGDLSVLLGAWTG